MQIQSNTVLNHRQDYNFGHCPSSKAVKTHVSEAGSSCLQVECRNGKTHSDGLDAKTNS
jgi:hypothetical protein